MTAHVTLPAGVSLLAADASTISYLQVLVAADTPPGHPPAISVESGGRRVTARGRSRNGSHRTARPGLSPSRIPRTHHPS